MAKAKIFSTHFHKRNDEWFYAEINGGAVAQEIVNSSGLSSVKKGRTLKL